MRAVITVVGKDQVGILARVATVVAEENGNIVDVSQTVLDDVFTMSMLVTIDDITHSFEEFKEKVVQSIPEMKINVMHENIFDSMHSI